LASGSAEPGTIDTIYIRLESALVRLPVECGSWGADKSAFLDDP
jgi:hypothetical protein